MCDSITSVRVSVNRYNVIDYAKLTWSGKEEGYKKDDKQMFENHII